MPVFATGTPIICQPYLIVSAPLFFTFVTLLVNVKKSSTWNILFPIVKHFQNALISLLLRTCYPFRYVSRETITANTLYTSPPLIGTQKVNIFYLAFSLLHFRSSYIGVEKYAFLPYWIMVQVWSCRESFGFSYLLTS